MGMYTTGQKYSNTFLIFLRHCSHYALLTSGYTSNLLCVVTGMPARASVNVFGSVQKQ